MSYFHGTHRRILSAILAASLFGLFANLAFAASTPLPTGAFIVSPVKQELSLLPGTEKTVLITLSNGTPYPLTITPSYEDIAAGTQQSALDEPVKLLGSQSGKNSLRDTIDFPKKSFDLLTGKKIEIPVTIKLNRSATPGGRYGSIVWSFKIAANGGLPAPANVALESRVASLFFVRVEGETLEEGKLVAFGLFNDAKTTPSPTSALPLRLQVSFENAGNVHLDPYGRVTISGMLGDPKVLLIDPWAVLPNATRMREIDLFEGLMPGYYHAHLELNRGYKDVVDEREVTFWVLPSVAESIVAFILLILLILLIRRSLALSRHSVA